MFRKLRIFSASTAVVLSSLLCIRPTWAQVSGDLQSYAQNTYTVLDNARALIEPVLTPYELNIARSIDYRVVPSGNNNGFALWENGRRVIVIEAGIVQSFEWIADALTMDYGMGLTGCFPAYLHYLADGIVKNSDRASEGLPLSLVYGPGGYATHFAGPCHAFRQADFAAKPELAQTVSRMIEASIMFLYLHELGHHVLNHVNSDMVDGANLAMHRAQEDAADRWAITTALRAKYLPSLAAPWLMFAAELGGNSIESENLSTHPLGLRRDLTLYQQTLAWLQNHPDQWTGDHESYLEAIKNLRDSAGYLQSIIQTLP